MDKGALLGDTAECGFSVRPRGPSALDLYAGFGGADAQHGTRTWLFDPGVF